MKLLLRKGCVFAMNFHRLHMALQGLTVYRRLLDQPVTGALTKLVSAAAQGDDNAICGAWGHLCGVLIDRKQFDSLPAAVAGEILADDNQFVSAVAAGDELSPLLEAAARQDLRTLYQAATLSSELLADCPDMPPLPRYGTAAAPAPMDRPWEEQLKAVAAYHATHGCGRFSSHKAFLWRAGRLLPVEHPDPIRLHQLKDYDYQRQVAIDNTRAFLNGFSANNMLLYGDRGTGKSSLVKALLNHFADRGLRMIEVPKEFLRELPDLTDLLAGVPMKFIIFIDDLSFSQNDDNFGALKAVLEGGLAARPENVLIYATSNRRHLLRETFADRQGDEVHHADTIQEAVSLSDRFGISLTFLIPDKERFLRIVEQLAEDRKLDVDREALLAAAERWALERGSRSPRYAKQFIADTEARLAMGQTL